MEFEDLEIYEGEEMSIDMERKLFVRDVDHCLVIARLFGPDY